jgi:membrane protein
LAIGIFFALFGASRLFITIDKCLTIVYRLPERTFLRQNILAFGMLFIFIILVIITLAASSAPSALISVIPGGGGRFGTFIAGILSSLLASFALFEAIYWIVPNKKMSFKVTWCGALVAACTLEVFIILFPLYVRRFMGNYAGKLFTQSICNINIFLYKGQIGFAVILLLFLYYFATILILGAQINAFFFDNYQPLFDGLGTYISQMHDQHGIGNTNKVLTDENIGRKE